VEAVLPQPSSPEATSVTQAPDGTRDAPL